MDLLSALVGAETRHDPLIGEPYWYQFGYPIYGLNQTLQNDKEPVPDSFEGYVSHAYKASGPVFACELVRLSVFSQARPMYRQLVDGRPGDLFSTSSLNVLRRPWPGGTTSKLNSRALTHADFAGNAFIYRNDNRLSLLRPDWVDIVLGSDNTEIEHPSDDPESVVVGYLYWPGGRNRGNEPVPYSVEQVAHFAPIPDPLAQYRGMSWLTPVVREVAGDKQATVHKNKFYENGATPNMVIKGQWTDPEQMAKWLAVFDENHTGAANAYRRLGLGAGMDATVVGKDFQQLDFKAVQGASETRIAAASGVGAVVAQLSEGLQGSSLNTGNYQAARRRTADVTFRPLWDEYFGVLEQIVTVPRNSMLWYDEKFIPFLQDDEKDAADIQNTRAQTIRSLLDAGWEPDSVVAAVDNDDFSLLTHSGLFSVQLQPPGATHSVNVPAEAASALLGVGWTRPQVKPLQETPND